MCLLGWVVSKSAQHHGPSSGVEVHAVAWRSRLLRNISRALGPPRASGWFEPARVPGVPGRIVRSMRMSPLFLPTERQPPADAEALSHKLMVRAGLVRQLGAGLWTWLPAGWPGGREKAAGRLAGAREDRADRRRGDGRDRQPGDARARPHPARALAAQRPRHDRRG